MVEIKEKFKFTIEYQWDLLRYTVQDKNGMNAITKWEDDYFTQLEHQIIAYCLKQYYIKHYNIPGETILREEVVRLVNSRKYSNVITKEQTEDIIKLIRPLYSKTVKDGEVIYSYCKKFQQYVRLKQVLEGVDINDFSRYDTFSTQVQLAIADDDENDELKGSFLIEDIKNRQFQRQEAPTVVPTPFKQINDITNAGGYEKGSIIVILDKEKKGKTMSLANVARGYLRMRKKILIIDLENGRDNIFFRLEQSIMRLSKKDIISGEYDEKVNKRFRKYKRMGGEVAVYRMPALVTTAMDIQHLIDKLYRETGFKPDVLIVDYAAKMGSVSRKEDERNRISDVYLELSNLALKYDIEHIWTANHVNREAAKTRMRTRYVGEDIALCIDIVRHANAIFGLNRSEEEEETGFFRFELVSQRDGVQSGRAVFKLNMDHQRADELSTADRKEYDEVIWPEILGGGDKPKYKTVSKRDRENDFES